MSFPAIWSDASEAVGSILPGSSAFRCRLWSEARLSARGQLDRAGEIRGFSRQQRQPTLRAIRKKLVRASLAHIWQDWLEGLFYLLSRIVLGAAAIAAPVAVGVRASPQLSPSEWLAITALTASTEFLLVLVTFAPTIVGRPRIRQRFAIAWQFSMMSLFGGIAAWLLYDQTDRLHIWGVFVVASALAAVSLGGLANVVVSIGIATATSVIRRRTRTRYPDAMICQELINAIWFIQRNVRSSADELEFRHYLVLAIEKAASILEHDMPRRLSTRDTRTATYVRRQVQNGASLLRTTKPKILMGSAAEITTTIPALRVVLAAVAAGGWAHVPAVAEEADGTTRPFGWMDRSRIALAIFKRLTIPIVLLVALRHYPIIDNPLRLSIEFIIVLWMIVTLLPIIDPRGDKLALAKEIAQFIRVPAHGWSSSLSPPKTPGTNESSGE